MNDYKVRKLLTESDEITHRFYAAQKLYGYTCEKNSEETSKNVLRKGHLTTLFLSNNSL